ncbi:hypothetical protein J2Y45_004249 [Dyadobacter sp. BE34]|uniref:Uncharacterized protein n=1 Tax=Dyadobacter fermentans TaxID=94254 RepID=A0ABU1R1Y9_9BACT|nr:hypothetical protein [Dyadobacter fermentans]MDR7045157.1 hypothetical protein [Dyadobacter sp. BE242]MDR7199106.1 hypothetical protein [Dyadobacter sp. BE34]MDR7217066.1 hypothetical protein [Dyadobacter sp. BE31]MDR7264999.1 hypothetical protein [Dyadobacter sp. BE32]
MAEKTILNKFFSDWRLFSINFFNFRNPNAILRYYLKYTKENIIILMSGTKIDLYRF